MSVWPSSPLEKISKLIAVNDKGRTNADGSQVSCNFQENLSHLYRIILEGDC